PARFPARVLASGLDRVVSGILPGRILVANSTIPPVLAKSRHGPDGTANAEVTDIPAGVRQDTGGPANKIDVGKLPFFTWQGSHRRRLSYWNLRVAGAAGPNLSCGYVFLANRQRGTGQRLEPKDRLAFRRYSVQPGIRRRLANSKKPRPQRISYAA